MFIIFPCKIYKNIVSPKDSPGYTCKEGKHKSSTIIQILQGDIYKSNQIIWRYCKIKELEDAKQKSSEKLRMAREQVNNLRDRRDQVSGQKFDVDEKLNVINKSVDTKKDVLQKLKSAFIVISEDALDHQVSIF